MPYPYALIKTAATGDILAASDYNNEHTNHITNNDPSSINDASSNVGAMQTAVNPGGIGTESLPTDLTGELQRLRYVINRIIGKGTQWYDTPDSDLHTLFGLNPTGIVQAFAGAKASVPSGWLYCDGSAVSRSTYTGLFAIIGTKHGQGNGTTTFNLPDLRGYFVRGQDDGQARDPDAASRTAATTGANSGDNVGSVQLDQYTSHNHTQNAHNHGVTDPGHLHSFHTYVTNAVNGLNPTGQTGGEQGASPSSGPVISNTTGVTVNNATPINNVSGGNETRAKNVAMVYIIKT